ncbi:isocitrate lyase/PEP mutase family protein [Gordonia aquimaris]|uniref:Isocitrate lyase/phosphoenolpyruvate mutase family protein n=1 Tax=Gordonia aquimaris TaxID=2984863 RepID=A0A9X3D1N7_9ACTN|nr:isocitrate lyase/phosphoenolpyruvate mutase family protein [Gordonia aquimaris]MCX2963201.1 isocitrate lyase/phosphoenolpyruvate mutase family protein [Gordonia aquimaris]
MIEPTVPIASPGARLRALVETGEFIAAPGIYDGLTAALVESTGFPAAYVSGGAASVAVTGVPDLGLMTASEMAAHVSRLRAMSSLPLIVDIDTGYGNELNVRHTIERMWRAGAAAVHIEDQQLPKRCGHLSGKSISSLADSVSRVRAAVIAAAGTDLMVIARTDALAVEGREAAITRAHAFEDAGADMIFIEAPESIDDLEAIGSSVTTPLVVNVIANSRTPVLSADEYRDLGFSVGIYPAVTIAAAAGAVRSALHQLIANGLPPVDGEGPADLFEIVGLSSWLEWPRQNGLVPEGRTAG